MFCTVLITPFLSSIFVYIRSIVDYIVQIKFEVSPLAILRIVNDIQVIIVRSVKVRSAEQCLRFGRTSAVQDELSKEMK